MSNKDHTEPREYRVKGFRLNYAGGVIGTFDMTFNVRSITEAVEQAEYVFNTEDIRIKSVRESYEF